MTKSEASKAYWAGKSPEEKSDRMKVVAKGRWKGKSKEDIMKHVRLMIKSRK